MVHNAHADIYARKTLSDSNIADTMVAQKLDVLSFIAHQSPDRRAALDGDEGRRAIHAYVAATSDFMVRIDAWADCKTEKPIQSLMACIGLGSMTVVAIREEYLAAETRLDVAHLRIENLCSDTRGHQARNGGADVADIIASQNRELASLRRVFERTTGQKAWEPEPRMHGYDPPYPTISNPGKCSPTRDAANSKSHSRDYDLGR